MNVNQQQPSFIVFLSFITILYMRRRDGVQSTIHSLLQTSPPHPMSVRLHTHFKLIEESLHITRTLLVLNRTSHLIQFFNNTAEYEFNSTKILF